jgi:hypothetical protein
MIGADAPIYPEKNVFLTLDIFLDFGEAVQSGAVGDVREIIVAVDEQCLNADTASADDIYLVLVADV